MNIKHFSNIAKNMPPHISILLRAPTGVGKSSLVKEVAIHFGIPLIDVRGSTMCEGDAGGYPDIESMKETGIMSFCMPSWFVTACTQPVVLFLDELNRSLPGVQQSFFQLVLDRQLGNDKNGIPYNLHPETRVFAAINKGNEYDVNEMDPALLRRFWVCDIENTQDDWLSWAANNKIDNMIIEFISKFPRHLRVDPSTVEQGKVIPCQASWARLDETFKYMNINLFSLAGKKASELLYLCDGFVGTEAAIELIDFIEKYKVTVTGEDVILKFNEVKEKIKMLSNDRINSIIEQIGAHSKINNWDDVNGKNISLFAESISDEMMIHLWSVVSSTKKVENITVFHKYIGNHLINVVNKSRSK